MLERVLVLLREDMRSLLFSFDRITMWAIQFAAQCACPHRFLFCFRAVFWRRESLTLAVYGSST